MVVIRLARSGSTHRPFYHVVVADQRAKRDGKFIERLGYLNYFAKGADTPARIDQQRFDYWLNRGAVVRPSVRKIIRNLKRKAALPEEQQSEDNGPASSLDNSVEPVQTSTVAKADEPVADAGDNSS